MTANGSERSIPILVVDDDATSRALIALALRRAGLDVIDVSSGLEALEVIESRQVRVVVCDVGMPGMSGIELVAALRRRTETATLPIILVTGSGDEQTVIEGLTAGADDFLAKPVRLDELVARVRAHIRTREAWSSIFQEELRVRAGVVAALETLTVSAFPEETAEAVVNELSTRTDSGFVSVAQVLADERMQELATFNRRDGVRRGGVIFPGQLAEYLLGRARSGPWVEEVTEVGAAEPTASFRAGNLDLVASAPIFSGGEIVGLLSIGRVEPDARSAAQQARLLAAASDYSSVLSALAGHALAGRREASAAYDRLTQILDAGAFDAVFQPVVEVDSLTVVGYEALTRFHDGVRPNVRFAEAMAANLGPAFELAAMGKAVEASGPLPMDAFLSINLSPMTVIAHGPSIVEHAGTTARPMVFEITEHVAIEDYVVLRAAIEGLGLGVQIAVDDAGAGYASLRHVLELRPAFAKLDISLVRGIDGDEVRQAIAAGMNYFALRTGCRLIAEGVETQPEADALQRLGVELAQGYLYGRPGPVEELVAG